MKPGVFYKPSGNEVEVFHAAFSKRCPLLLVGPTGCGKTRFVEFMSHQLDRPLIQVSCNEDTSASDLMGRYLLLGNETVWQDGPVAKAARSGAILYMDEIAEAREDVIVLLHPLTDHRRIVTLDKKNEQFVAHENFMVIASFNPGYQSSIKSLKPSTRQRFVTLTFDYPEEKAEIEILANETGIDSELAKRLVKLAHKIRATKDFTLVETISTRILVHTGRLILAGLKPRQAAAVSIANTLTDDPDVRAALMDVVNLML